jgi:5-formyltetrahydrofolate cyclo-ligase
MDGSAIAAALGRCRDGCPGRAWCASPRTGGTGIRRRPPPERRVPGVWCVATIRPLDGKPMETPEQDSVSEMVAKKRVLRFSLRAQRDAVPAEQRATWSARICERAIELPAYQSARFIHCFLSIQSEVETRVLIQHALAHGKRVAAPLFVKGSTETAAYEIDSLDTGKYETGAFGLAVPRALRLVDLSVIDVFFVPLLAFAPFTLSCEGGGKGGEQVKFSRLGYGIAYYDRLLARKPCTPKVGLAFELQRVESLPVGAHDQLLDCVLTEK